MTMNDVAYAPIVNLPSWTKDNSWLLHDRVYSINEKFTSRVGEWSKIASISAEFLQRPRKVVLKVDSGRPYLVQDWTQILNFIGKTFTNTQVFRVTFWSIDECGGIGPGESVDDHYRENHIHFLEGLTRAVERSSASTFSPNLETLEVENIGDFCSYTKREKLFEVPTQLLELLLREVGRDADSTRDPAL